MLAAARGFVIAAGFVEPETGNGSNPAEVAALEGSNRRDRSRRCRP